jgi:hemolysin III
MRDDLFETVRERAGQARDSARDRAGAVRERARDHAVAARDRARERVVELAAKRPRLRGVSHQWACVVSVIAGAFLVWRAPSSRATIVAVIYAASMVGLFGVSAVYHRVVWNPGARRWMRRLDHSMIYVFMAGSATPVALLVVGGTLGTVLLCVAWGGALLGVAMNLAWIDAPRALKTAGYVALGWVGVIALPELASALGAVPTALFLLGGVFYTAGAIVYAKRRPDPVPAVFGYHEVFHALVVAAALVQFVAVAGFVLPLG